MYCTCTVQKNYPKSLLPLSYIIIKAGLGRGRCGAGAMRCGAKSETEKKDEMGDRQSMQGSHITFFYYYFFFNPDNPGTWPC